MNFQRKTRYRIEQFLIFALHIFLLFWILHVLNISNSISGMEVFYHFLGLAALGAGLIIGTAKWALHHHRRDKEASKNNSQE